MNEKELIEYLKKCEQEENYKDGLDACLNNENIIEKKYYEYATYKIIFLMKLEKYIEAAMIVKEELAVPYCPKDFFDFLKQTQKQLDYILKDPSKKCFKYEDLEKIDQLDNLTLLRVISQIAKFNLVGYEDKFQNIFNNDKISDTTKTIIIALLSDCKIDYNFTIMREGVLVKFNPSTVYDIRNSENVIYVHQELSKINYLQINIAELVEQLIMMYLLSIYPLFISEEYCDEIITSALILATKMNNVPFNFEKYALIYKLNYAKIEKICEKMNNLIQGI